MIKNLELNNFKCYKDINISFAKFNVITGVNSSGKSTILQALKLHSISEEGEVNLRYKDEWDFIGYKELLNNDYNSEFFSINVNENKYIYKELLYNSEPKNNLVKVTKEGSEAYQENEMIFIDADRYFSRHQREGDNSKVYLPKANNENLADYLFFNSERLPEKGMISMVEICLKKIGLIKSKVDVEKINETFKVEIDGIDIQHVGTGVRYVLPIILTALSNHNSTICIENPEIHLHPEAQIKLMEQLSKISKENNNQIILETHSDHIINACRVLRKNNDLLSDELFIAFVSENKIEEIEINDNGRFNRNIKGFFDEYELQLMKLL